MKTVSAKKALYQTRQNALNFSKTLSHKPKPVAVRRSQLIENRSANAQELFQNWLLRTGDSPKAGLPASQIGIYTDFQ